MPQYTVMPEIYDKSLPQIVTAANVTFATLEDIKITHNSVIIDAGCGTGQLAEALAKTFPKAKVIGLDNAENMLEFAKSNHAQDNLDYYVQDLTSFNSRYKKSADLIVCSWVASHIPSEAQAAFTANLHNYLKENGQLLVFFPVMGSMLASSIQEIAKSAEWSVYFKAFENKRTTFNIDDYEMLLRHVGFDKCHLEIKDQEIRLKDETELKIFIETAIARYLPLLKNNILKNQFIHDIAKNYKEKVGSNDSGIPYKTSLLIAKAKRTLLALNQESIFAAPLHDEENMHDSMSGDQPIAPLKL